MRHQVRHQALLLGKSRRLVDRPVLVAHRQDADRVLAAFAELDPSRFHLHVVGPHEHRRDEFPDELMTFHGWLSPAELRAKIEALG